MDINTLSSLIKELILTHDRVSLPGIGSFITEIAPSVFSDRALVINPPFKRLLFRTSETWNDELLENLYAQENKIDLAEAKERISSILNSFVRELNSKKSITIKDFGTMRATTQNDYYFVAEKDIFIYPETYGLEPINIKTLSKQGVIEYLNYKEVNKIAKPIKVTSPIAKVKVRVALSRSTKKIIITLVVLFSLIAIIALMVVFKEDVKPIWEWLLYNKEERELLKQL